MNAVAKNKAALRKALKAFTAGDTGPFLELVDSKAVWVVAAPRSYFPFGGASKGRRAVKAHLALLAANYRYEKFDLLSLTGERDTIWACVDARLFNLRNRKRVDLTIVTRWIFRNGKIHDSLELWDSASALIQERRIPKGDKFGYVTA